MAYNFSCYGFNYYNSSVVLKLIRGYDSAVVHVPIAPNTLRMPTKQTYMTHND